MTSPPAPRDRRDFDVAFICALTLEADCVLAVFDKFWDKEDKLFGKTPGDPNAYTTGTIGDHNVVLAHMPGMGKVEAARVAAALRTSFQNIKLAIVVGICGGRPSGPGQDEIFLGDIIISDYLVQDDFGRQYPESFERKKSLEDCIGRPNPEIRALLSKLKTDRYRTKLRNGITLYLEEICSKVPSAKQPPLETDKLFEQSYLHKHQAEMNCNECDGASQRICSIALKASCDVLGCADERLIVRNKREQSFNSCSESRPVVHFGRMGSGDMVIKSGHDRDRIAEADGIIAFEMEGAGVGDNLPSIVIKGVCDYADSHKNKDWQSYAAACAAACLKAFLKEWVSEDRLTEHSRASFEVPEPPLANLAIHTSVAEVSGPLWHVPFDKAREFIGRAHEIRHLQRKLLQSQTFGKVAVLGLGGIGKSRLALEIAYIARNHYPEYSIFWINATQVSTFEKDMLEIGRKLKIPGVDEAKADAKSLVKNRLNQKTSGKWLIILDNADEEEIWVKKANRTSNDVSLAEYLPKNPLGSILITTRSRWIATHQAGKEIHELQEMSQNEALQTFKDLLIKPEILAKTIDSAELLDQLTCLPLAIVQVAAYINQNDLDVREYLNLLSNTEEDDVIELLSEDFEAEGRYEGSKNPIATTWLISFEQILRTNSLAADYLSFMACLHEKSIPQSLLPEAESKKKMIDAIGILKGYSFLRKQDEMKSGEVLFDMHRLVRLATRNWMRSRGLLATWTETTLDRMIERFPLSPWNNNAIRDLYMPHAQLLCVPNGSACAEKPYDLLEVVAFCMFFDGHHNQALQSSLSILNWREQNLGIANLKTLSALEQIGGLLNRIGQLKSAETYLSRALDGYSEHYGKKGLKTLQVMSNLVSNYQSQGRYQDAKQLGRCVLDMSTRLLRNDDPDTWPNLLDLAKIYMNRKRYDEAEKLLLQILESNRSQETQVVSINLQCMWLLAHFYYDINRLDDSEWFLLQVLDWEKKNLCPEHENFLMNMNFLAQVYLDQWRLDEAEIITLEVLEIIGRTRPDYDLKVYCMSNLSEIYTRQQRYEKAADVQSQVLELAMHLYGSEHFDTIHSMAILALRVEHLDRHEEALRLIARSAIQALKVLPREHPEIQFQLDMLRYLAEDYENMDDVLGLAAIGDKEIADDWTTSKHTVVDILTDERDPVIVDFI